MTTMMSAILSDALMTGPPSRAVSDEARYINDQAIENWRSAQETQVLGNAELFDDLEELADECGEADWDGYGAAAISREAINGADGFLRSLPAIAHRPTLGAEPDGQVTFEWHTSPKRTLSVSVGQDGMLHYSALIGSSRYFGTEPFLGDCPNVILQLVQRVRQA